MATGDQTDFLQRQHSLIAPSWFPAGESPVLDTVLSGGAYNLAWIYSIFQYVLLQARLATATGVWLDRISYDFLANDLPRLTGETDLSYRARIKNEILRERNTRKGIILALEQLTGITPKLYEPWHPGDVGAYDIGTSAYDQAGMYGDLSLNNQLFITAYRPVSAGVASIVGYDNPETGYDIGTSEYIEDNWITGQITDAMIYATVAKTIAAGMTAWVNIATFAPNFISAQLDFGSVDDSENIAVIQQ